MIPTDENKQPNNDAQTDGTQTLPESVNNPDSTVISNDLPSDLKDAPAEYNTADEGNLSENGGVCGNKPSGDEQKAVFEKPAPPLSAIKNEPNKKKKWLKILVTVLFVGIIAGTIIYTAVHDFSGEKVDFGQIMSLIGEHWYYLLVLLGLFVAMHVLEGLKISFMLYKTTGKFSLVKGFNCAVIGRYYDYVTPLGSGGQPFQMHYLGTHGVPVGPAGAIPISSFFLMQFSFFLFAIVSFILGTSLVPLSVKIVAYFGAVFYIIVPLFLVIFSFMPKAGHKVISFGVKILTKIKICKTPEKWIEKGNSAIDNNRNNLAIIAKSRVIIPCFFLSVLYILAQCSMPYFTLLLFGENANGITLSFSSYLEITKVTFFIYSAITFMPTPGNSGAADGTFYGLFKSLLPVAGSCFIGMTIWRIFSFYLFLLLGLALSIGIKIRKIRKHKRENLLSE